MYDVTDLRATIIPKSDQLNSEQLLAGSITVQVSDVAVTASAEQPVTIFYEGDDGRPYKPCKTMRKVLILAWGMDGTTWAGKSMTLYNDPNVKFGGAAVGGIRISHLSDIERDIAVSLTATKGKKTLHTIKAMKPTTDTSAKAKALRVAAGVASGDAAAAALAMSGWAKAELDAVWKLLLVDVQDAISAAWPAPVPA